MKGRPYALLRYSTKNLRKKDLVRFYYAFKGRDGKSGILHRTDSKFLSKGLILCDKKATPELEEFFKFWGCEYAKIKFTESKKPTHALITYSTRHLEKKDLVRFFYALKGRDSRLGIIQSTNSEFLAKGVLLTPINKSQDIKDFLKYWKCKTTTKEVKLKK